MFKKKHHNDEERKKKSLRFSVFDGSFYSVMTGFGESFFSAFAVFLKATNLQLGLLGSLPHTIGSLFQLWSTKLIRYFHSRKKFILIGAAFQGLMYIAIASVFFFSKLNVYWLIFFVTLYTIFGNILIPAWSSWMGDLVSKDERGAYFGMRNKITGFVSIFATLTAGYLLQRFGKGTTEEYIGFLVIFSVALIGRLFSIFYLSRMHHPKYCVSEKSELTFKKFLKGAKTHNYGVLIFYLILTNMAVMVAGPFFTAYMLKDLEFNYLTFTLVNVVSLLVKFACMPVWGKAADRFGEKKVLTVSGYLIVLVPLFWMVSTQMWWLLLVQIFSGFAWAGFELASFNSLLDSTNSKNRAAFISYYNVLNGSIVLIGALIGTIIVRYNNLFWSAYLLVFFASFLLRAIVASYFIPKLKEVRKVEEIEDNKLLTDVIEESANEPIILVGNIVKFVKEKQR